MGVKHREGINPAVPRDRTRPKIADMLAGNADLLTDGKVTGRTITWKSRRSPPAQAVQGQGRVALVST
jgi:hypothetical protein